MGTRVGRHEEFGAPSWAALVLGLFLLVPAVSPLLHHNAASHTPAAAAQVMARPARPAAPHLRLAQAGRR